MAKVTKTGIVSMVSEKDWTDNETGEDIVLYSFQVDGDKRYFRTGTDDPEISEGDAIRFVFDTKGNKADVSTIEDIDPSEVEEAPAPKKRGGNKSRGGRKGGSPSKGKAKSSKGGENWDARAKYWEEKEKRDIEVVEPRITFSAAQRDAVAVVTAALDNDALSFGNAAKGAKLDMLLDFVDQVAARFYDQRINGNFPGVDSDDEYDEEE